MDHGSQGHNGPDGPSGGILWHLLKVERGEVATLAWSCAYFFCLLSAYYILRPLRDAKGIAVGEENLPWLYLGSFLVSIPASIAFAAIATRMPRRRFIPYAYRFFIVNLLVFLVLLKLLPASRGQVGPVYFIWVSVFNLFVVSIFWSFMADLFSNRQGKRLFGVIAVGGTLGQVFGATTASLLAEPLGADNLLIVSMVLLECACWCVYRLNALRPARSAPGDVTRRMPALPPEERPIGGNALGGLVRIVRSPYLTGIALFMICHSAAATFLYMIKLKVGEAHSVDEDVRVSFFATIDVWTGWLTVLAQVFLTGRLMSRLGVGLTLAALPAVTLVGLLVLGTALARPDLLAPTVVLVGFEAIRRSVNFAFSRPAREVLYTVVPRDDKYKAKNAIDTVVYRGGDQVNIWVFRGLRVMGLSLAGVAFVALPLTALWLALAVALGRAQRRLAGDTR